MEDKIDMRKLICLLLAGMMLLSMTACAQNQTSETQNPTTSNDVSDETHQDTPAPAPNGPVTKKEDLGENMCVTKDDVPFSKLIKMNDYEFVLGCKLDDFLAGIGGTYIDSEEFQTFRTDKNQERCWIKLSVEKDGKTSVFDAMVEYDDDGNIVLVSLVFDPEVIPVKDLCVGLEVFGVDILNATTHSFPVVLQEDMVYIEMDNTYTLLLVSYYDDYSYFVTFGYDEEFNVYKLVRISMSGK